jgi:hypothetical protein
MVRPLDRLMVLSEVEAPAHHKWEGIKGRVNINEEWWIRFYPLPIPLPKWEREPLAFLPGVTRTLCQAGMTTSSFPLREGTEGRVWIVSSNSR